MGILHHHARDDINCVCVFVRRQVLSRRFRVLNGLIVFTHPTRVSSVSGVTSSDIAVVSLIQLSRQPNCCIGLTVNGKVHYHSWRLTKGISDELGVWWMLPLRVQPTLQSTVMSPRACTETYHRSDNRFRPFRYANVSHWPLCFSHVLSL